MKIGQNSTRNPMVPSDLAYLKAALFFLKMCPKPVPTWGECNGYCPGEYTGGPTTTSTTTPATTPTTMTTPDPGNCGIKPSERIVGGSDAAENSFYPSCPG